MRTTARPFFFQGPIVIVHTSQCDQLCASEPRPEGIIQVRKVDHVKKTLLILISAAAIAGCNSKSVAQSTAQAQPAAKAPASANLVSGQVAETMNAGGYTYVRIGDQWAAIPQTTLKVGDNITIAAQMVVPNFESKSLNRKFDKIIFGSIPGATPAAQPAEAGAPSKTPAQTPANVKVEKAEGGKTIAEVWAGKKALKDKPVVIRGTVVKFLPDIMGKNWMHLRDGSGTRAKGDDDITVTTSDSVKVGDVVTVKGTLYVDKDFGAGYEYPVIVEDAKLQKQ
jgi:hypothetical protein